MRTPSYTNQFEKDLQRLLRRGKDAEKLKRVITSLVEEEPLPERYRDHSWSATIAAGGNVISSQIGY